MNENPVWAIHCSVTDASASERIEYETDRVRFLGARPYPGQSRRPGPRCACRDDRPGAGSGFQLAAPIRLEPGAPGRIGFVTGAADTREAALGIAGEFRDLKAIDRAFATARIRCHDELREMSLTPGDVALFDRLAAAVVFTSPGLRQPEAVAANRLGQPGLWPHAISGDLPIVVVRVAAAGDEPVVRQLVQWRAHARRRGLELDLVILDERGGEAAQRLRTELAGAASELLGKPGGIFLPAADRLPADDAVLLAAAVAVLGGGRGSLGDELDHRPTAAAPLPPIIDFTLDDNRACHRARQGA